PAGGPGARRELVSTTTDPRVVDMPPSIAASCGSSTSARAVIEHGTRPGVVELIHTEIDPERQLAKPLNSRGRGNEATAGRSRQVSEGGGARGDDERKEQRDVTIGQHGLTGQRALVTGATSGIGRAVAL